MDKGIGINQLSGNDKSFHVKRVGRLSVSFSRKMKGDTQKKLKETKSYGKRRKFYKAKGDLAAAARELASPEGIDRARARAYVGYARMETGVESRVMKLMKQNEDAKIKDIAFLKSFRRTENQYLRKFVQAIAAGKLVLDRYERLKMYIDTIKTVFDHARVESAPPWVKIYWVPTRGAKHCPDCLILAVDSPYTKKTLPTTPRAGDTKCLSNCKCHLMIRFKKPKEGPGAEEEKLPGIKPPGEEYELHPDLYSKFKGDVPEFRFFLDKNIGNPVAARKEFVAAVKKAGVGFEPSNYQDPYNRRFFKSNNLWTDIQKIKDIERTVPGMSPEGIGLRKKRQGLMGQLLKANTRLRKDGLRWIRPDGHGGYSVGVGGKPITLFPKG